MSLRDRKIVATVASLGPKLLPLTTILGRIAYNYVLGCAVSERHAPTFAVAKRLIPYDPPGRGRYAIVTIQDLLKPKSFGT